MKQTIEGDGENLAVVRLTLTGKTTLSSRLELDRSHWKDEFLSVAQRANAGNVWLESVVLALAGVEVESASVDLGDFAQEVFSRLSQEQILETFSRHQWPEEIDQALRTLSGRQLNTIDAELPLALRREREENTKHSDSIEEHAFLTELRNLVLSSLDLPAASSSTDNTGSLEKAGSLYKT